MRYEMTVTNEQPITERQAEAVMDSLGDDFDSAYVEGNLIEIEGTVSERGRAGWVAAMVRRALGWTDATRLPNSITLNFPVT